MSAKPTGFSVSRKVPSLKLTVASILSIVARIVSILAALLFIEPRVIFARAGIVLVSARIILHLATGIFRVATASRIEAIVSSNQIRVDFEQTSIRPNEFSSIPILARIGRIRSIVDFSAESFRTGELSIGLTVISLGETLLLRVLPLSIARLVVAAIELRGPS